MQNAAEFTALRRWVIRPDRVIADPFGNLTVRANMHAGADHNNVTGESGPEDPDLSIISFQSLTGRPDRGALELLDALLLGVEALNADYFGYFCEGLKSRLVPNESPDHPRLWR